MEAKLNSSDSPMSELLEKKDRLVRKLLEVSAELAVVQARIDAAKLVKIREPLLDVQSVPNQTKK